MQERARAARRAHARLRAVGGHGGTCTCPNGEVYLVGAPYTTNCAGGSPRCYGGTAGPTYWVGWNSGESAGLEVTCAGYVDPDKQCSLLVQVHASGQVNLVHSPSDQAYVAVDSRNVFL